MSFKTKDEYEAAKYKFRNKNYRKQQPEAYSEFQANEKAWNESQSKGSTDSKTSSNKSSNKSMQIKGNSGSSYPGETMKISRKDAEFVDFGTVFSDKDHYDPGTKFAKKGTFKDYLNNIKSNAFDQDGNLIVPKYDMPDRVELSKEQKKANEAIDSQLDGDGYYKANAIAMPTMNNYKTKKSYAKRADILAARMGINDSNGKQILADQKRRYDKKGKKGKKGKLIIPDFAMKNEERRSDGKKLYQKGMKNTSLDGIKS